MKNLKSKLGIFAAAVFFTLSAGTLNAQKLTQSSSNIKVTGTSTLHAWDMTSTQSSFTGNLDGNNIDDVKFSMKVTSLKSKDASLDKNAYKALNTSKYTDITFTAASIPVAGGTVNGKLTIAGNTQNISLPVKVAKSGNGYTISGNTKFKMSNYGVKPPTVMMGAIKSGDEVTINFNVTAK